MILGLGTKIPNATGCGQNKKKKVKKEQFRVLGLSIFKGSRNGKERAKETEKLWLETEEENPGSVVSWKQI